MEQFQIQRFLVAMMVTITMLSGASEGNFLEGGNYFEAPHYVHSNSHSHSYPQSPIQIQQQQQHNYQQQQQQHQHQQHQYPINSNTNYLNKPKSIPAVVPISPVYDVEVMKPSAQLEEKKTVTLFIVPQNSLHVYPTVQQKFPVRIEIPPLFAKYQGSLPLTSSLSTSPGHIPAIEVPLEKPMVLGTAEAQVISPAGFIVNLNRGPDGNPVTYPIQTAYLLAPVPVGTIISPDTPVVLTTIYAVPSLPSLPSSVKILAEFNQPLNNNKLQGPVSVQSQSITISNGPGPSSSPIDSNFNDIPLSPPRGQGPFPLTQVPVSSFPSYPGGSFFAPQYPESPNRESITIASNGQGFSEFINFPGAVPSPASVLQQISHLREPAQTVAIPPSGIVSGTAPQIEPPKIHNSKESPYLTQLREQSLKRQIFALQKQLENIQSSRG